MKHQDDHLTVWSNCFLNAVYVDIMMFVMSKTWTFKVKSFKAVLLLGLWLMHLILFTVTLPWSATTRLCPQDSGIYFLRSEYLSLYAAILNAPAPAEAMFLPLSNNAGDTTSRDEPQQWSTLMLKRICTFSYTEHPWSASVLTLAEVLKDILRSLGPVLSGQLTGSLVSMILHWACQTEQMAFN